MSNEIVATRNSVTDMLSDLHTVRSHGEISIDMQGYARVVEILQIAEKELQSAGFEYAERKLKRKETPLGAFKQRYGSQV